MSMNTHPETLPEATADTEEALVVAQDAPVEDPPTDDLPWFKKMAMMARPNCR